jgi:amidohydrolase
VRTGGIVANELRELGMEVTTGVGKTGVVAILEGDEPGPVAMLRFDMDALPIQEATGAKYASQNPGVMHACGHDAHTAIGLSVARMLQMHREEIKGSIKFVFQPAEEGLGGAEAMIKDGVLRNPAPDFCLGLHVWNDQQVGWLGATPGPTMAAAEIFEIHLEGKGGHGALPHLTVDPVVAAAQMITAFQSIVSRNVAPLQTAVISVGSINSGDAFNVIPQTAHLKGTIRTFDPQVRNLVIGRFYKIASGIAEAMQCKLEIEVKSITPALVNNPKITGQVQEVMHELLPDHQIDRQIQTMGSEDMAFFQQEIPGCYFFVGSANSADGLDFPHHHPQFDIDEAALPRAVALMTAATIKILRS